MPEPTPSKMSMSALNALEADEFTRLLGNVVELSPSVAYALARIRPLESTQRLLQELNAILDSLPDSYKKNFLKRFNELGKVKPADMTQEQRSAQLNKLSELQLQDLVALYAKYKEKFGFPFVVCARDTQGENIADALRRRLENSPTDELVAGIKEIKKIAKYRVRDLVA